MPPATEAELKLHVGGTVAAGVLVIVQVRATAELNPLAGVTVTVEVEVAPGATEAGVKAVAVTEKLGVGAAAVTLRLTVAIWVSTPEVPVTVMLL